MANIEEINAQLKSIKIGIKEIKPAEALIQYIEDVRVTVEEDFEDAADWLDNIADEIRQWYKILQDSTQLAESVGSIVKEADTKATKAEKAINDAKAKIAKAEKEAQEKIDGAEAEISAAKQKAINDAEAKIAKAEKEAQEKIDGAEAEISAAKQKAEAEVAKAREDAAAAIANVDKQIQTEVAKLTAELQKAAATAQQEAKEAKQQAEEAKEKLNSFNKDLATLSETLVTNFGVDEPSRINLSSLITMVSEIRYIDPKTVKKETVDLATVIGEKFADLLVDFTPRTATLSGLKTIIEELEIVSPAAHKRLQRYTDQAITAFKEKFGSLIHDEDSIRSAKDLKTAIDDLEVPNPKEIKQLKQKTRECVTEFIAKFGDDTALTPRSGLDELCEAIRTLSQSGDVAPEEIQRYREQITILQQALTESKEEITDTIKAYRNKFGATSGLTEYATLIELRKAIEQYIAPRAQVDNDEVKMLTANLNRLNKEAENACDAYIRKFGTTPELIFNKSATALTEAIKKHVIAPTPASDTIFEDPSVHFFNNLWKDTKQALHAKKQGQLTDAERTAAVRDLSNRCDTSQVHIKELSEKIKGLIPPHSYPTEQDTQLLAAIRDGNVVRSARLLMDPAFVNGCSKEGIQKALIHAQERSEMKGLTVLIQGLINRMS